MLVRGDVVPCGKSHLLREADNSPVGTRLEVRDRTFRSNGFRVPELHVQIVDLTWSLISRMAHRAYLRARRNMLAVIGGNRVEVMVSS